MEKNLKSIGREIKFRSLAKLLDKIHSINVSTNKSGKNEEKKRELEKFIEIWRKKASDMKQTDPLITDNFFPVMRLLLPSEDRRVYGLKESKLAQYLIKVLCLSEKSEDYPKLKNFAASHGDFASAAFDVLKKHCRDDREDTLSIEEINDELDKLAMSNARGKPGQVDALNSIKHMIATLSASQLKWVIRIILKDLKIGIKELTVLDAFHPDAIDFFNVSSSLEKVCDALNDPNKRLNEISISLFSPFAPMLGDKAKPSQIERLLNNQNFYIETKFDGERFQLHKNGEKYGYYSRNSHDYSDTFGRTIENGTLTPFIHESFAANVKNIILDGEMCGFNISENVVLSTKGEYDVKSNSRKWDDIQTCYCVFDILLYNDIVLTNKPLKERIEYIKKAFKPIDGRILISEKKTSSTNKDVADALNEAIDQRKEGIVVKDPNSVYKPNVRSGSGWFKVKPDYMLGLNDDLDLLIVGGYLGRGKRTGMLTHFLLAVAVDDPNVDKRQKVNQNLVEDDDDDNATFNFDGNENDNQTKANKTDGQIFHPKKFQSFCKIGTGYTYEELYNLNLKLNDKWKKFDKNRPPSHLELTYEKPEFWIDPKDSMIVQIKAVEICPSSQYKTGVTLRFPRLEKFREDKPWHQCLRLSELNEMREKNDGKLAGKHANLDDYDEDGNLIADEDEPTKKKKRAANNANRKATVDTRFKGIDASNVNKVNNFFEGKEFCVMIGNEKYDKQTLETFIVQMGGTLVQNPLDETFCVVSSKKLRKLDSYIQKDLFDIVKVDWLIKCIEKKQFVQWRPSDMIHSKSKTKKDFAKKYDSFGDSYTEDLTIESLKEIFSSMQSKVDDIIKSSIEKQKIRMEIAAFENEYFPDDSLDGLFRLENVYLDIFKEIGSHDQRKNYNLDAIGIKIKWHGGLVSNEINEHTTKCILDKSDKSNLTELRRINRERRSKFRIVSSDWVIDCLKASRFLAEDTYHL